MPFRQRDAKPSKNVTLSEILNWIAFDNFFGPPTHPAEVTLAIAGDVGDVETLEAGDVGDVETLEVEHFIRRRALEMAEDDLFDALRDGDIQASGRFSDRYEPKWHANEWTEQGYENHSETRSEIPADFWRREGIDWHNNSAKSPHGEYVDIILSREKVLALWPLDDSRDGEHPTPTEDALVKKPGQKRGRKQVYSETDFFALCVWEAAVNDLPETQATFVDRMERLLAVVWGEDKVPGETWLKEKIGHIYKHREKHELGRRQIGAE